MKNDIADILFKYTTGEATLEETNDALKEAEAGFNLEPGRNEITPDEMALTTVGDTPEEANGFGLLDTGTGSMEKVHVTNGKREIEELPEAYIIPVAEYLATQEEATNE